MLRDFDWFEYMSGDKNICCENKVVERMEPYGIPDKLVQVEDSCG